MTYAQFRMLWNFIPVLIVLCAIWLPYLIYRPGTRTITTWWQGQIIHTEIKDPKPAYWFPTLITVILVACWLGTIGQ